MAGSNAVEGPAALLGLLATALEPVQVTYDFPSRLAEREIVWGGDIGGPQEPLSMRGSGRRSREERLIWQLRIEVAAPGKTALECARRATVISKIVEEALAAAFANDGAGVAGLLQVAVVSFDLKNFNDDDGSYTDITLGVLLHSTLK
jgi:hypothetical protein